MKKIYVKGLKIELECFLAGTQLYRQIGHRDGGTGTVQKTKLNITRSIFEVEARNFACKQILTTHSQKVKNKMAAKSLNFQARSPKFCMEVYLDHPQPKSKKMAAEKQNGRHKTKSSITRSIFKLEARDFACKQILTASNYFRE